jgi:hypothetical protein
MQTALRWVIGGMIFGTATIGAMQIDRTWATTTARGLLALPQNYFRLELANEEQGRLADSFEELQARVARKRQIVRAVGQGSLPLRCAVQEFLAVSQNCSYEWNYPRYDHPEWSKEKCCAQVIVDSVSVLMEIEELPWGDELQALQTELADWMN